MLTAVAPLVFVVDDNPSVRKSLSRLLALAGYTVEAFESAREFLTREPSEGPCCLVLDVRMPGLTGIELQEALAAAGRRMAIVFVTGHVDVPTSVKAMKGGAVDLLTKPVDREDLLAAIARAVAKDAADLSEEMRIAEIQQRVKMLTVRETQVFARVVTGRLNKQIASDLGVVLKTVKAHRARVMEKMRAGSVAELVRLADAVGMIVPSASDRLTRPDSISPPREGGLGKHSVSPTANHVALGSRASRNRSPTRLIASTVRRIASPGSVGSHQATVTKSRPSEII